ncbi:LEAF RUST 10 DISEASE-RESISTANCE LOCUS RECEPTOR-LIKE PROTEIN KINASE-like 2.3 [Impatiens glandulifera]|uniref:LEAF RUST 10 DISEASE-RESISTANCE LOCUS RECEPTOR-LIKE PROTEIN KINASE-like 2.3 n=1 Tax=Impatiens glandulifera TaxID=253017 RepID=UPI001FB11620|nr:LEAF RUST 10 DISEASE-RESISTANCE LOCUS RECEPTOR-LIKE PROTEIN KINASE-like 2.3 [Impatiens glandulifera]
MGSVLIPFSFSLFFFLLSYDLVLSNPFLNIPVPPNNSRNERTCPPEQYISCRGHDYLLKFPLKNFPYPDTRCGLWTVDCSDHDVPTIQNAPYDEYSLETKGDSFIINDTRLASLISDKDGCGFVEEFFTFTRTDTSTNISIVNYSISPNMTVFKCSDPPQQFHFVDLCPDNLGLYFNYSAEELIQPPPTCFPIVVPIMSETEIRRNTSDLFSLLASQFTIQLYLSEPCSNECHPNPNPNAKKNADIKRSKTIILATAVSVAVIVVVVVSILVLIFYFNKRISRLFWKKNQTDSYFNVKTFLKNYDSISPKRYTHSDIKKMTNSFKVILGKGGYGSVYKGNLQDGTPVAVKILENSSKQGTGEEFINEVASIGRTSHINVVTLLGFCSEYDNPRSLVYEFMPNGSLEKYINDNCQLGRETLYKIVLGIARGLEYLHRGCNTRILHLDIKPHNILLDTNFCPKIADFGLAKVCSKDKSGVSLSSPKGTYGYIAPEVFSRAFGVVSLKSDVYSFGMMILEMVGGGRKNNIEVDHEHTTNEVYFPDSIYQRLEVEEVTNVFEEGKGMERKMIIVGLWCIQTNPNQRPSMSRVVEMLEGSLDSLHVPPKPYLSTPSLPIEDRDSSSSQMS